MSKILKICSLLSLLFDGRICVRAVGAAAHLFL